MVKRFMSISLCIMALVALPFIAGCGSGTKEGSTQVTVEEPGLTGVATCSNCHPIQTLDWKDGGHTNRNDMPTFAMIGAVGSSECRECHDPNDEGRSMNEVLGGNFNARPVNGCETCHGNGGNHFGLGPITKYRVASSTVGGSQFNTCNTCHRLLDKTTGAPMPAGQHATNTMQLNHLGTAGSWTGPGGINVNNITGYAIDPKNNHACSNCHNPHKVNIEINKQWNASRHADRTAAGAWAHYNWSQRADCQRCHTASGYAAFATKNEAGLPYVAATDAPIKGSTTWKPEMLACNGCHTTNYDGGLRNPKAIKAEYSGGAASFQFPDVGNSNICMACHTGRENGDTIKASTGTFTNLGFINSHYLTAGSMIFTAGGYEYAGRDYTSVASYRHDDIGMDNYRETGTQGPCVACHMSFNTDGKKHTFLPVVAERNDPNNIHKITRVTAIASTVCAKCHDDMTPALMEEQRELLHESMQAFAAELNNRGIFFGEAYPYFYTTAFDAAYVETGACSKNTAVRNWQLGGTTAFTYNAATKVCTPSVGVAGAAGSGKDVMGAAFNFNIIEHDPGSFVHNRRYVRRLIYDSIDYLDDGILNDSVNATLNGPLHAGKPYQAGARSYILSSTGGRR